MNDAFKGGQYLAILELAGVYLAVSLASGLTKLGLNVYRNWVGENAVRQLRTSIDQKVRIDTAQDKAAKPKASKFRSWSRNLSRSVNSSAAQSPNRPCKAAYF